MRAKRDDLIPSSVVEKEDLKAIGMTLANRIKNLCKTNEITIKDLENKSKVKLGKILSAKKIVTINEAKSLAKILKTTPEYIIAGD